MARPYKPPIPDEYPDVTGLFITPRTRARNGDWHIMRAERWRGRRRWAARLVGGRKVVRAPTLEELVDKLFNKELV